jgi:hypothetical protein
LPEARVKKTILGQQNRALLSNFFKLTVQNEMVLVIYGMTRIE